MEAGCSAITLVKGKAVNMENIATKETTVRRHKVDGIDGLLAQYYVLTLGGHDSSPSEY